MPDDGERLRLCDGGRGGGGSAGAGSGGESGLLLRSREWWCVSGSGSGMGCASSGTWTPGWGCTPPCRPSSSSPGSRRLTPLAELLGGADSGRGLGDETDGLCLCLCTKLWGCS